MRPAPADLVARRAALAARTPSNVPDVTVLGGVECRVVRAEDPIATIVYLHGGGYRMGTAAAYTPLAGVLAEYARAEVIVVDYRLAPEHPYPAALHDATAVCEALNTPVILAGDSAGGGLATALLAAGVEARGLVLLSPWLDLRCTSTTFTSRAAQDLLFPLASAREAADQYLQGHPADDPLVSPVLANLTDAPPTLIFASAAETLLGDALALTERLTDVTLHVVPGMTHAWPVVHPDLPETQSVVTEIGAFVRRNGAHRGTS